MTTVRRADADELAATLDGLAAAVERARDDVRSRAVLARLVAQLEDATDAGLGEASADPLVVLQRRFGRAHARLAGRAAAAVDVRLLHGLADALTPEPADPPAHVRAVVSPRRPPGRSTARTSPRTPPARAGAGAGTVGGCCASTSPAT